ncbi:MAG: hypothetical protein RLZZ31_1061 [Actinomycetota bacterium]|jgi:hypothetical protein
MEKCRDGLRPYLVTKIKDFITVHDPQIIGDNAVTWDFYHSRSARTELGKSCGHLEALIGS